MKAFLPLMALFIFALMTGDAFAQSINIDLGKDGSTSGDILQLLALITVLSLAPSIVVMVTSFTRIVVVFSLLRSALGLQTTPPTQVLVSLAMFMTFFIMTPTFEASYEKGIKPLMENKMTLDKAMEPIGAPFHAFMAAQVREKDLELFLDVAKIEKVDKAEDVPYRVLIPAFMISELRRAFEIGFMLFIPFLIVDMIVASTLMAMGMMMLPPVVISLPFKLVFFVLVDGWYMVVGSLIRSFAIP